MRKTFTLLFVLGTCLSSMAQSAADGGSLMQQDIKGTARFMSMGGAFGALGGDMSTLSYNPAGIGIYRRSEVGVTADFDIQSASTSFPGSKVGNNGFKFILNNGGYIGSLETGSKIMPNFNWGITYNRKANFNRKFSGVAGNLTNSLSNYIAGVTNNAGVTESELEFNNHQDPYLDSSAPWISILGYDSYYISPSNGNSNWTGQFDSSTTGVGYMSVFEKGGIDEYNLALGGNLYDIVYWGMDFALTHLDYRRETIWGEALNDAYVNLGSGFARYNADWDMYNDYRVTGVGFNYKFGVIVKPIQELRLGFSFHTPTWYNLTDSYYSDSQYTYSQNGIVEKEGKKRTNDGYYGETEYKFRTPWRFIAGIAGVIGNNLIVSFDYDWTGMQYLNYSAPDYYDYDYYFSPAKASADWIYYDDGYSFINQDVKNYYKTSSTFRVGAEYRILPQLSVRAGYAYTSSPVKEQALSGEEIIYTADPNYSYEFDNDMNYVSFGLGYKYKSLYVDMAYVYRNRKSEWHAWTPGIGDNSYSLSDSGGPVAKVSSTDNQIIVSMGFRF